MYIVCDFLFLQEGDENLSVDIKTKVLNDLDEKIHGMAEMLVHRPELDKLLNKNHPTQTPELVFAYYILYICSQAFHMRQRKVLSDNEWSGWLLWMKIAFDVGQSATIGRRA
jgi:hypothetical protein